MRNGGRLLVECLVALGATKSFGVPGESYLAVLDALHDADGALDYVLCRNEAGAAFMASACGKLTGSPGICFVTRGPGAANASVGVHTAMQDSSPMILFVGQAGTDMKGREAFQKIDCRAVFGTVAKWAVEIDDAARLPEIVARAWTTALTGRPGPVVVALPEDMPTMATGAAVLGGPVRISEPAPHADAVDAARATLAAARRPAMLVGDANWTGRGRAALQAFAEASDIPVVAAFRFQDQFDNNSPVFAGEAGVGMAAHVKALIRAHQERSYPARVSGTTLANPDFAALARTYGFHAERVEATDGFAAAFERAHESETGAVLDIAVSPGALPPRQTLSQMRDAALASQKAKA